MSTVIRFPSRRFAAVLVCRQRDGEGWLAIAGSHGWLFGSILEARAEALEQARAFRLPIRELVA
jgi:hypothetical protein